MTAPRHAMTNALKTGSALKILFCPSDEPPNALPTYKKISPTAVKVAAKPKLKTSVRTSP